MAVHTFMTDREFNQTALDTTARFIFDRSSELLSQGIPVQDHLNSLKTLSSVAVFANYSNTTINFYFNVLDEESSKNDFMEGWVK